MIQMLDLKKQFSPLRDEILKAVAEVLESGQYVLGPRVKEFERRLADYIGMPEGIGLASGTDALHLALQALGIGRGDEVITTPFTFFATVEAILYVGATPVFVDIDPGTFNISPGLIEARITPKTRAIIPVHMFGLPADMPMIMEIAGRRGLKVVEDCAQSVGAGIRGTMTGAFGDAGCFSFYPTKNLGAYGDGGFLTAKDNSVADLVRKLRNHGSPGAYLHEHVGVNSRLDEIQAAILLIKLRHLDEYNNRRRRNAALYNKLLSDAVVCPIEPEGSQHVYHQYTVRTPQRDEIRKRLADEGIASMVYYPLAQHMQPVLRHLEYREGDMPEAESAAREVISLPVCPELSESQIELIASAVRKCV
jgi:dTDP-4-amino-4,6-dideoxygalactose transaminase